jgi:hypothetical protein
VHILKGSNLVGGSRSCIDLTSYIDFISCIDLTALRKKDRIKAKKADGVELKD